MADYYPLIARAVAGLEKNTGDARRALYERARTALVAQLRSVNPPLSENDVTRERLALEESIRKVEAEAARQFVEPSRRPPTPKTQPRQPEREGRSAGLSDGRAPESRYSESRMPDTRASDVDEAATLSRRYVNPPSAATAEARQDSAWRPRPASLPERPLPDRSAPLPDPPPSDSMFDRPLPADGPASAPQQQRHPLRRPVPDRRPPLPDAGRKDFRDVVSEANELGAVPPAAQDLDRPQAFDRPQNLDRPQRARDRTALDRGQVDRGQTDRSQIDGNDTRMFEPSTQERMFEPPAAGRPHEDFSEPMLEPSFSLEDSQPLPQKGRRPPPLPSEDEDEYEDEEVLRPRRSYGDLIKGLIAAVAIIIIGAVAFWQWPNMVGFYRTMRAPSTDVARDASQPSSSQAGPKKTQERIEPGSAAQAPAVAPGPGLAAVAQKVVLYEEDPDDPNGKRFVGSAIWRTETVTPGPGQSPELAIRADVEVPERKLAMTWSLRRNTDKTLPASHTVEIMFKLPGDFPSGGISNVPGILMKQAESTRGVPLAGLAVKVTNGFYLIGLSSVDADKDRNLQLLKERGWFDIPVVYNNNRRAILAMEKGTPGERAFAEAFKAWKQ